MKSLRCLPLAATFAACSDAALSPRQPVSPTPTLSGTWQASFFEITPPGGPTFDMLHLGASLTITVDTDERTAGRLVAPFGSPEGRVIANGPRVRFDQEAETFVRLLEWTWSGDTLAAIDHPLGETRFTVRLVRGVS
ncbi:MAG: hypothetical protein H7066_11135 [Cytophagaceae bacterium]|nr:hypothetical protein [Gemmatimonadaceae bacterium]